MLEWYINLLIQFKIVPLSFPIPASKLSLGNSLSLGTIFTKKLLTVSANSLSHEVTV